MDNQELTLRAKIQAIDRHIVLGKELESKVKSLKDAEVLQMALKSLMRYRENYNKTLKIIADYSKNDVEYRDELPGKRANIVAAAREFEFQEARAMAEMKEEGFDDETAKLILNKPEIIEYGLLQYLRRKYNPETKS